MMAEIIRSMSLIFGVMRLDPQAAKGFENSVAAFGRSYIAFSLALPIYFYTISLTLPIFGAKVNALSLVMILILYQAIEWLLWANLMLGMSAWMKVKHNYCRYMVAYNWLTFAMMLLYLPVQMGVQGALGLQAVTLLAGAVVIVALIWQWSIAKHALEIDGKAAAGVVLTNLMMKMVLGQAMAVHLAP